MQIPMWGMYYYSFDNSWVRIVENKKFKELFKFGFFILKRFKVRVLETQRGVVMRWGWGIKVCD